MADRESAKLPPKGILQSNSLVAGDANWIKLRDKATGGIIDNTAEIVDDLIVDGEINVANCPAIAIALDATLGSLTNFTVTPYFTDESKGTWFISAKITGSSSAIGSGGFVGAGTGAYVMIVQNPGASWMRLTVQSSGPTTSSLIGIWVGRIMSELSTYVY